MMALPMIMKIMIVKVYLNKKVFYKPYTRYVRKRWWWRLKLKSNKKIIKEKEVIKVAVIESPAPPQQTGNNKQECI